jgi:hypothetical protein
VNECTLNSGTKYQVIIFFIKESPGTFALLINHSEKKNKTVNLPGDINAGLVHRKNLVRKSWLNVSTS